VIHAVEDGGGCPVISPTNFHGISNRYLIWEYRDYQWLILVNYVHHLVGGDWNHFDWILKKTIQLGMENHPN